MQEVDEARYRKDEDQYTHDQGDDLRHQQGLIHIRLLVQVKQSYEDEADLQSKLGESMKEPFTDARCYNVFPDFNFILISVSHFFVLPWGQVKCLFGLLQFPQQVHIVNVV